MNLNPPVQDRTADSLEPFYLLFLVLPAPSLTLTAHLLLFAQPAAAGDRDMPLSPWCFEQLCGAAATAITAAVADGNGRKSADGAVNGGGVSGVSGASTTWMLSRLSKDDMALLARHLVRTRRAVREEGDGEGLLKILRREGSIGKGQRKSGSATAAAAAGSRQAILAISETEKDLLRLRGTGEDRTGQGRKGKERVRGTGRMWT